MPLQVSDMAKLVAGMHAAYMAAATVVVATAREAHRCMGVRAGWMDG